MKNFLVLAALLMQFGQAQGGVINRADFGPSALSVDFSGGVVGSATYTSGNLTVSGGNIQNSPSIPPLDALKYTNDGGGGNPAGAPIRLDFATQVSAIGLDAYYNNSPVLFDLYDSTNTLLDSLLSAPTDYGSISGYLGLNVGADLISYAIFSLPGKPNIHNLYIDNIIYQSISSVPEPATLALLGLGLAGFVFSWQKKGFHMQ